METIWTRHEKFNLVPTDTTHESPGKMQDKYRPTKFWQRIQHTVTGIGYRIFHLEDKIIKTCRKKRKYEILVFLLPITENNTKETWSSVFPNSVGH